MSLLYRVWGRVWCYLRLVWLFLTTPHQPLDGYIISLLPRGKGVRRMIARGIWAERHERRGARIVPRYSYDPVVERRERRVAIGRAAEHAREQPQAHRVLAWRRSGR